MRSWVADVIAVALTILIASAALHVLIPPRTQPDHGGPVAAPPVGGGWQDGPGRIDVASVSASPLTLELDGDVSGLYPGARLTLPVTISNTSETSLEVQYLAVVVNRPAGSPGCPAEALLLGNTAAAGRTTITLDRLVEPGGDLLVAVALRMATDAPSACQNATFPLHYTAEAVIP